ncbi:MAG: hypothetical protein FWG30_11165 [Eubacteriaceae bacterium]|nr:hypothetical protein [Eubacteriaceae bacterium]
MPRNEKEVYLGMAKGEMPDYVPIGMPYKDRKAATATMGPWPLFMASGRSFLGPPRTEPYVDLWGVPFTPTTETNNAALPTPGEFILKDITKWDQYIKKPEMPDDFDWETFTKDQLKDVNREEQAVSIMWAPQFPFQQLMTFTGFNEGLMAMCEEPESVLELLDYMVGYYYPIVEKCMEYYKPDLMSIADDTATRYQTFFSVEHNQKFFKPIYQKFADLAEEHGVIMVHHNCGRCEDFIPDMMDWRVKYWNPAQTDNDLVGIKEKYKKYNFNISGGWDFVPPTQEEVKEEDVRQKVRDTIDKYAPGGGYIFGGGFMQPADRQEYAQMVSGWIIDEAYEYGKDFYSKPQII